MIQLLNEDGQPGVRSQLMTGERNGMLSRDGLFFHCGLVGHRRLANDIVRTLYPEAKSQKELGWDDWYFDAELYLEQQGWVKLSENQVMFSFGYLAPSQYREPSAAQVAAILAWHELRVAEARALYADFPELYTDELEKLVYNDDSYTTEEFLAHVQPT